MTRTLFLLVERCYCGLNFGAKTSKLHNERLSAWSDSLNHGSHRTASSVSRSSTYRETRRSSSSTKPGWDITSTTQPLAQLCTPFLISRFSPSDAFLDARFDSRTCQSVPGQSRVAPALLRN